MSAGLTTRSFVLEKHGYDGLALRTRDVPEVGTGQVLVRMRAASLNFRDLKILNGTYQSRPPKLPRVLLSDGAGEVVEVGPGASQYGSGDRVLPIYMEGWHAGPWTGRVLPGWKSKGGDTDGVALDYAVYDAADLLPIPQSFSYEEAACLPCAGVTAWHGLVYVGRLKAGDTVLVQGSGGVAIFAIQIAKMSGARVIATSSDDAKLQRLIDLGASYGINYVKTPAFGEAVRALTGGRGVDHVVEVGGVETLPQSLLATKDGGRIASIGNLSGRFARPGIAERGIEVTEIGTGSREMTEDLMRAMNLHQQAPVIDRVFAFERLKEALAFLETGRHFGKVVLRF
jgi:NADPH:quinone reductase-like Zn-dependent oxidoreductase